MPTPKGQHRSPDMVTVFKLSPVNGALYNGDQLPAYPWDWPHATWLKRRMEFLDKVRRMKSAPSVTAATNRRRFVVRQEMRLPSGKFESPRLPQRRNFSLPPPGLDFGAAGRATLTGATAASLSVGVSVRGVVAPDAPK